MDSKKSQAINFAFEVMPMMFHSQTSDFITYLTRDGLEFLQFWWNYIGNQLEEGQLCSFEGMDYDIFDMDNKDTMIIITMPAPHDNGEAYFLLLTAKPEKHFAWVRLPTTRVLALVRNEVPENPNGTELADITPRGRYVRLRKGPDPNIENMTRIGMELLKPQPT